MPVDTELAGSPEEIEAAARWLRDEVAAAMRHSADGTCGARSTALAEWGGQASDAFVERMRTATERVETVEETTCTVAGELAALARRLRALRARMRQVRAAAREASLTVTGFLIFEPGPAPAHPGHPARSGSPGDDEYDALLAAWTAHQQRCAAYRRARERAEEVRADLDEAVGQFERGSEPSSAPYALLSALEIAGGLAEAGVEFHASALGRTGASFTGLADDYRALIREQPLLFTGGDLDHWDEVARRADDLTSSAEDLRSSSRAANLKLGGGLALLGVALDLHNGEDPAQAVASNGGGLLASVAAAAATGAAVGSVIPVPGVATAAGAVIGAAAGVFASGAIDGLFDEGPDVSAALDGGLDALGDTGQVIGDGVGDLVKGVGGLFD